MKIKTLVFKPMLVMMALGVSHHASANLQQLIDEDQFNGLEREAANAALTTYTRLLNDFGCRDDLLTDPGPAISQCSGQRFRLFSNVREILQTANEITGVGPTLFSLGSDVSGLGFALRWTAGEEYAAQGSLSSEFVNGQISSVATRITALRSGARGFNMIGVAAAPMYHPQDIANANAILGAGASGDAQYSPWGGFVNYDYGKGDRAPTALEDAFDFENSQITAGMDYRINDEWIVGAVFGISDQTIDFDSSLSIVEGGVEAEGQSIMPFVVYQKEEWFASASLGWQQMTFDTNRAIRYPSFNLQSSSTNTVAVSSTDADMLSLFLETGYSFQKQRLGIEPFFNIKYSDINVDEFVEDDINNDAFDLVVQAQSINSFEYTLGTKFQYTLTPNFGVFIPYFTVELVNQTDDAPRVIEAYYAQDGSGLSAFNIPTEELDSQYMVYSVGLSSVLRGSRQKEFGGSLGGDVQAFFTYRTLKNLEGYSADFYTFGARYTF